MLRLLKWAYAAPPACTGLCRDVAREVESQHNAQRLEQLATAPGADTKTRA